MEPVALEQRLQEWLASRPGLFDLQRTSEGVRLVEVATGKALKLLAEQVLELETRRNSLSGAPYLLLRLDARPTVALADAGFVFDLDTRNTGAIPNAPPAMSFRDHRKLFRHLQHLLGSQSDPEHRREALDVAMILIASLDGARALGLSTEVEEGELEAMIRRLEAGG
ncbi:MAG: hypothetical protein JSW67_02695 [Candidatus Latescibacterota bacterium]|nr:MAG: hypothetical protein JSW67_02695 [Candidatus Latescibacterota bacterium]